LELKALVLQRRAQGKGLGFKRPTNERRREVRREPGKREAR
jgi:hypothetical protein